MPFTTTAIRVGFEETSYNFEEPQFIAFRDEQVCLELFAGSTQQTLRFSVIWDPVTATEGIAAAGGDYVPRATVFVLNPGAQLTCIDISIQRDARFELREEFTGRITSVQLPDGTMVPAATGVTILPGQTSVFINNVDGKGLDIIIIVSRILCFLPVQYQICITLPLKSGHLL